MINQICTILERSEIEYSISSSTLLGTESPLIVATRRSLKFEILPDRDEVLVYTRLGDDLIDSCATSPNRLPAFIFKRRLNPNKYL